MPTALGQPAFGQSALHRPATVPGALGPIDTVVRIVTPENIAFQYEVAGPIRRGTACLLDLVIRSLVFLVGAIAIGLSSIALGPFALAVGLVAWFLIEWFYGALFETYMNGQTPGKRILGLRVVTTEGQPINGLQAVLRNLVRSVDMMPPISLQVFSSLVNEAIPPVFFLNTGLLGLIVMVLNDRYQRLGDLVSGTMVISEDRHRLTGLAQFEDPRVPQLAELIPPDFLVPRGLSRTLATYVERRRFFTPLRRKDIARHLAEPLLKRFGLPLDTSYDLLLCALYYRTFVASHGASSP